ncbi:MAG: hypothetical protein OEW83_03525 [Acidimicrobiia bacterium]|nr:hypothetical protein [Acidimicrobiia bacterium]
MLASFFGFYVNTSAIAIGEDLSPAEARVLAIELEDAEQRLDDDRLLALIQAELPELTIDEIDRIADDSWTRANRRATESAFVIAVLTLAASTFIRRRSTAPADGPQPPVTRPV